MGEWEVDLSKIVNYMRLLCQCHKLHVAVNTRLQLLLPKLMYDPKLQVFVMYCFSINGSEIKVSQLCCKSVHLGLLGSRVKHVASCEVA